MSRLIDADRLMKRMEATIDHNIICGNSLYTSRDSLICAIKNSPDVDAVPVVHAHWVKGEDGHTRCSHCTQKIPYYDLFSIDRDTEYMVEIEDTTYCPNCGSIMDEE